MRFDAARPAEGDPVLRYSLAEFAEVIFAAFDAANVRTVVEIGAEGGAFTDRLVRWTADRGGQLVSVDPAPSDRVRSLAAEFDHVELHLATSHRVLDHLAAKDAYLLDGDHNYYTVTGELAAIHRACTAASSNPLVILQDVGWPTGTRDMYYFPESLPPDAVHPLTYDGVVPWSEDAVDVGGFRGEGQFAVARREGGPANGVLTALEDFLAGHDEYQVIALPCIFGLAIVFPGRAEWAGALRAGLGWYDDNPMLARLESNRILLYLKVLDLQDRLAREGRRASNLAARLEADLERARTETAIAEQAARASIAERDAALSELQRCRQHTVAAGGDPPARRPLSWARQRGGSSPGRPS